MTGAATAVVVGGGPAGLIAAEELARAGVGVAVFDHRGSVGRKLLLAGRAGLNLTHAEPIEALLDRFGPARGRLAPAVRTFGPDHLRAWCEGLGEATFVGSSGRVFPASFRATPLLRAWLARLDDLGVRIEVGHRWLGWTDAGGARFSNADGVVDVECDVVVLALGGASWPRVGSDGGWVAAFDEARIQVHALRPANVGVRVDWTAEFAARFAGEPLKNVLLTAGATSIRGEPVVTASGLEGGPVYALTVPIRELLDAGGRCVLSIDLAPDRPAEQVAARLAKRRPKDSSSTWLRRAIGLHPVMVGVLREATANRLPDDPVAMAALVKAVPVVVVATMPIDRAISTGGGVAFAEVDDRFMLRRRPGTFVAGEMLDWEAPTGGYLLQGSFSTGVAAARGAIAWLARHPDPPGVDH